MSYTLPDSVRREVAVSQQRRPRQQPWVPVPGEPRRPSSCAPFVLVLALISLLTIGFVIYAVITSNEISDLRKALSDLKTQITSAAAPPSRSNALRLDAIVQRQELPAPAPSGPPRPVPPLKAPVAERPKWAAELKPRWLQFETPFDEAATRLPPEGGQKGIAAAGQNGFKIECTFGGSVVQPTREQVDMTFYTNDETGDEYAMIRVPGAAFRGRDCVLEWMAQ